MNISFFGSSLVSSYWNGAATYYRGLLKEIAALGHTITFFEPDAFDRQAHRDIDDPAWARVVIYPATTEGWQQSLAQAARSADLLIKASGVGVFDTELEHAVTQVPSKALRATALRSTAGPVGGGTGAGPCQQAPRSCQTPHSPVVPGSSPVVHHLAFQLCPLYETSWPPV